MCSLSRLSGKRGHGHADMENADMENADIETADMENADMENADKENADKHIENSCMVKMKNFMFLSNIRQNSTKTNSYRTI